MISCHGIVKRFGRVTAVDGATFSVPDACICGFLGPNGAGKTTTIRMVVGALAPDSGTVTVDGIDTAESPAAARQRVGYLAEESPLYPELTVREMVAFRAALYRLPRAQVRAAVEGALQRCQVSEVGNRLCGQLSKGYRQRCGLAAAIVHSPSVLVLDEPTSGLDPAQVGEFRTLLRELARTCTVLLSSHVLAEVEAVCDRAVLIGGGRVAAQGTLAELRARGASAAQLVVESDRDIRAALAALQGVDGVDAERLADGWWRSHVRAAQQESRIAQAVGAAAAASGSVVRRLEWSTASLEEVFHRLIARGSGA